mmetsp:Transcript_23054/g.36818  ORF Transcript_23054/g.36818 Transcript_23054/m.36818 type:complete len:109 (-) Transcript_23054:73-399(-)
MHRLHISICCAIVNQLAIDANTHARCFPSASSFVTPYQARTSSMPRTMPLHLQARRFERKEHITQLSQIRAESTMSWVSIQTCVTRRSHCIAAKLRCASTESQEGREE